MATKIKIKKQKMVRVIDGAKVTGYIGKVISNGTIEFDDILRESTHGSTLDYREAKLAGEMMLDGIADKIKKGYIVDLGPLGKLYPATNSPWKQDVKDLALSEMKPKVNYKPSDDIAGAVRGASLAWTTEEATKDNTVDEDTDQTPGGAGSGSSSADDPGNEGD
ncbi:MAG: hypothetical protein IJV24_03130 [Prevotella sp.]|nr:hypothetical protein [Prevotella sp.]